MFLNLRLCFALSNKIFAACLVVIPSPATERGYIELSESFILSVLASIVAYYICKWLDGKSDNN